MTQSFSYLKKKKKGIKNRTCVLRPQQVRRRRRRGKKKERRQHRVLKKCGSQNGIPGEVIVSASFNKIQRARERPYLHGVTM